MTVMTDTLFWWIIALMVITTVYGLAILILARHFDRR